MQIYHIHVIVAAMVSVAMIVMTPVVIDAYRLVMEHVKGIIREIVAGIRIRAGGKMKIDWDSMERSKCGLYCYAITIGIDAVIRNRAYYRVEGIQKNKTKNIILDALIGDNLATCFSCGYEKDENIIKHDLHIKAEDAEEIYNRLSVIKFFTAEKIKLLHSLSMEREFPIENKIIGAKVSTNDHSLKNICLYFRCLNDPKLSECRDLLFELCAQYGLRQDFCLPIGEGQYCLRLIALDFGNEVFKLKYYFQFRPEYDARLFIKAFGGTVQQNVVEDIVTSNGWVGGFQIATMNNAEITYNFYMKERGA